MRTVFGTAHEFLRGQGRYADAIEYHRKAHHLKEEDTRPLYALVEDHEAQGDMERARSVVGRILAINKSSVAAWRKLRSLHIKEGNWVQALEAHQREIDYLRRWSAHYGYLFVVARKRVSTPAGPTN